MNKSCESSPRRLPLLSKRWFTRFGGYTLFAALAAGAVAVAYPGPKTIIVAVLVLAVHVFYFDITRKLRQGEAAYATSSDRRWTRWGRLADTLVALAIGTFIVIPGWVSGASAICGIILIVVRVQLGQACRRQRA